MDARWEVFVHHLQFDGQTVAWDLGSHPTDFSYDIEELWPYVIELLNTHWDEAEWERRRRRLKHATNRR